MSKEGPRVWKKALELGLLPEGRVSTVTIGSQTLCVAHHQGRYGALDNRCPHQGGPLGEGTIEGGWLRCPWHGWDYDPITGKSPGGFDDGVECFPVEVREDGVYVSLPEAVAHVRTRSDVFAETCAAWGVRWVFGMVGHSNLGLADALRRQEQAGNLSFIGIRHEGAASFAASAYGKLTGRPAACLSIAGPGATNLLTGLWDAHVDKAPVLALTGQVATQWLGRENFQEVDLRAAFGGVAQFSASMLHGTDPGELASLALRSATLNSGVSHVIFPDEVQNLPAAEGAKAGSPKGRVTGRAIPPEPEALDAALALIRAAKRPLLVVGHGARFHMPEVIALAEHLGAAVVTTFKGKGLVGDDHPLAGGVLGRSGTPIASWFMNETDLMVVFGASFSNHTGITSKKITIQVDRDPAALGHRHAVAAAVQGDIGRTATAIREALGPGDWIDQRPELAERWALWRAEKRSRVGDDHGEGVASAALFDALTRLAPADAVLAVDVGNNTYSFGRYFEPRRQAVLMSGYLGSIGFGLPAAIGAWCATREAGTPWQGRKVISISGDGGLGQYLAELTTLVKYGMNITHIVLNNGQLGKISKEQRAGSWEVWQTSLHNPSFAATAELCGLLGLRVERASQLDEALARALAHPGPSLVEVIADPSLI